MTAQDERCQTSQERANSSYRPSWFVALALFVVIFTAVRVAAGAPLSDFVVPVAGLLITLSLDLISRRL